MFNFDIFIAEQLEWQVLKKASLRGVPRAGQGHPKLKVSEFNFLIVIISNRYAGWVIIECSLCVCTSVCQIFCTFLQNHIMDFSNIWYVSLLGPQ